MWSAACGGSAPVFLVHGRRAAALPAACAPPPATNTAPAPAHTKIRRHPLCPASGADVDIPHAVQQPLRPHSPAGATHLPHSTARAFKDRSARRSHRRGHVQPDRRGPRPRPLVLSGPVAAVQAHQRPRHYLAALTPTAPPRRLAPVAIGAAQPTAPPHPTTTAPPAEAAGTAARKRAPRIAPRHAHNGRGTDGCRSVSVSELDTAAALAPGPRAGRRPAIATFAGIAASRRRETCPQRPPVRGPPPARGRPPAAAGYQPRPATGPRPPTGRGRLPAAARHRSVAGYRSVAFHPSVAAICGRYQPWPATSRGPLPAEPPPAEAATGPWPARPVAGFADLATSRPWSGLPGRAPSSRWPPYPR
ncbi:MAG: hypothetical protein V7637_2092 [Mycobacteriales bacterium]